MSGVDVVGLTLGVLTVIISAAEHYRSAREPFTRWRAFHRELECFDTDFKVEETIFRMQCLIVLRSITSHEIAEHMLKDKLHHLWEDQDLQLAFTKYLGQSGDIWASLMMRIDLELVEMDNRRKDFSADIERFKKAGERSFKRWRSRVARKLDFSVSGPILKQELENLRTHNRNLRTLTKQIMKEHSKKSLLLETQYEAHHSHDVWTVSHCQTIRKAALRLCKALGNACRLHVEHRGYFRLQAAIDSSDKSLVRFNLALQTVLKGNPVDEAHVWVTIESFLSEYVPCMLSPFQSGSGHQVIKSNQHTSLTIRSKKTVTFETDPISCNATRKSEPLKLLEIQDAKLLPDLSHEGNFCKHMQMYRMERRDSAECLGYLERSVAGHHRVFSLPGTPTLNSLSLAQMMKQCQDKSSGGILQYDSICLAKQLASAVLDYNSTPLLQEGWRSNDVVFFDMDKKDINPLQFLILSTPHVNIAIKTTNTEMLSSTSSAEVRTKRRMIRNSHTFALGVILIELAYQSPLNELRKLFNNVESDEAGSDSEFYLADTISSAMTSQLGKGYKELVHKCINCDFGAGFDLSNEELQERFHKDVICVLDGIERHLSFTKI